MTPEQQLTVQKLAVARQIEIKFYEDYSARFAFGVKTQAITLDNISDIEVLMDDYEELTGKRPGFKMDNLGKGFILY